MKAQVSLSVNDLPVALEVEPRTLLVHRSRAARVAWPHRYPPGLRYLAVRRLHSERGRSRGEIVSVLAVQMPGREVTTIEGLAPGGDPNPTQKVFQDCHGLQCGFSTPEMVMSAIDLVVGVN